MLDLQPIHSLKPRDPNPVRETIDTLMAERDELGHRLATVLERIGLVTGIEISTNTDTESVQTALDILDSLVCPTTKPAGHYWVDPLVPPGQAGAMGPFDTEAAMIHSAKGHAATLPQGYLTILVAGGRAHPAIHVWKGKN